MAILQSVLFIHIQKLRHAPTGAELGLSVTQCDPGGGEGSHRDVTSCTVLEVGQMTN